jgi:hypothetical protein
LVCDAKKEKKEINGPILGKIDYITAVVFVHWEILLK